MTLSTAKMTQRFLALLGLSLPWANYGHTNDLLIDNVTVV